MSLLEDLANGKDITLASGGKLGIKYETDGDVLKLTLAGNSVDMTSADLNKLLTISNALRMIKTLEPQV